MSQSDETYPRHPGFNQPSDADRHASDQTLPFVDLYSPSPGVGGGRQYGANPGQSDPYGAPPRGGGQYPHQQGTTPPYSSQYQSNPYQNPGPYPYTMSPQPVQYGYYGYAPTEHPQSTVVLVLGLLGFVVPVTPFIAWYMGNKAKAEIERGAPFPYSGSLKVGHIIGKVLSILTLVAVAGYTLLILFALVGAMAF